MCSCQFVTHSCQFGILSRNQFFQFYESENVPAIFVSGEWHQNFETQHTNSLCMHYCHHTAHNIYLIHTNL
jgi:hypothetical protein